MSIASEIFKGIVGLFDWFLHVDHPFFGIKGVFQSPEFLRFFQRSVDPLENQFMLFVGFGKMMGEFASKNL